MKNISICLNACHSIHLVMRKFIGHRPHLSIEEQQEELEINLVENGKLDVPFRQD